MSESTSTSPEGPVEELKDSGRPSSRRSESLFGPFILIGLGVYFLLDNLNVLPELNWGAALRLWPLLLIFWGLNIIVRQFSRPFGTFLSALVALLALATFGSVLLFSSQFPFLERLSGGGTADLQREHIAFPAEGAQAADVTLDFSFPSVELYALEDSSQLIEGDVSYTGGLTFETGVSDGRAQVNLATTASSSGPFFWLNPSNWGDISDSAWRLGLNPIVLTDLNLNLASGSAQIDLSELSLSDLTIEGGSGSANVSLPGGDYDVVYDVASGSVVLTLPADGRHTITIDGGSGSLNLILPAGMVARIEAEDGSGGFNLPDRFDRVSGERGSDEGVWETAGYEDAADRLDIFIDAGSGSVNVDEE
ncbi:MAG: DUF5668 domain-containing protein [Chloroflexota bacterium]